MSDKLIGGHIDAVSIAFERPDWYLDNYAANIRVRCETVGAYTKNRVFEQVLDVGCGDGSLSLQFLGDGCNVSFLDVSSAMLEKVRSKIPGDMLGRTRLLKGDFTQMDLEPFSFDLVLCVGLLAYVSDVPSMAKWLRQLIRPGGLLIAECSDAAHFLRKLDFAYCNLTALVRRPKCHIYRHRAAEVSKVFQRAGFILQRSFRYTYSLPVASRLMSQEQTYAWIRRIYGDAEAGHHQEFGSESLMLFEVS